MPAGRIQIWPAQAALLAALLEDELAAAEAADRLCERREP